MQRIARLEVRGGAQLHNESGYVYDLNGNIKNLVRNGSTGSAMDNLTYTYTGNQLLTVGDTGDTAKGFTDGNTSGNDYAYDTNGNMVTDKNKSLTASNAITYDHLNLPIQVVKSTSEKIIYTYDAGGRKLKQDVYNSSGTITKTTDYAGEFIYQGDTLQFINHEEGRVVMKANANEYQYHLKDHLGNVRVTFTTLKQIKTYNAGFETANQTTEASYFGNSYPNASHINTVATNAHSGSNSLYLNGSASGGQVGVAKSFSVMPGDVVSIQAYAKYNAATGTQSDLTGFAVALLSAFNMTAPAPGETGTARAALNTWGGGEAGAYGDGSNDNTDPRTFVTILMFDRNFTFLDVAYQQLTSSGVMNASYTAKQPGYAYIYVSNEEGTLRDVYIDDVTISQTQSPVVQQEDFYPFGLKFNSFVREASVPNTLKLFQNQEHIDDLGLDWDQFKWRNHQPEIGRFFNVDPLAEEYVYNSTYAFSENKVVNHIELEGLEAYPLSEELLNEVQTLPPQARAAGIAAVGLVFLGEALLSVPVPQGKVKVYTSSGTYIYMDITPPAEIKRSASDQKLIDQASQQKTKDDAAKARDQKRQQQTKQGKDKEGKSNQETRGNHDSGSKSKANQETHEKANARRAREQKKADEKKEKSKSNNNGN